MKNLDMNDHTKQYRSISGHRVSISFAKDPNPELFTQLRDILLTCSDTSHICPDPPNDDTISSSEKEAS